jgi:hypothetical protein
VDEEVLTVANRYWAIHESFIGELLVRCYNQDITPAEALALMLEHSDTEEVPNGEVTQDDGEAS